MNLLKLIVAHNKQNFRGYLIRPEPSLLCSCSAQSHNVLIFSAELSPSTRSHVEIGKGVSDFVLEFIMRSFPSSLSKHIEAKSWGWKA